MSASSASTKFLEKLPGLLSSGEHSDVTLICGGKTFKVHKLILCTQSEVFRKILDGDSMGKGARSINLPDEDPLVLQVLLHFMYHFTIDDAKRPNNSSIWVSLVHLYAIADKYDVPPLKRIVLQRLDDICDPTTNVDAFVALLRVVADACTAKSAVWDILVPKVLDNITLLLPHESFQDFVVELPSLTLQLLGMLQFSKYAEAFDRRRKTLGK